MFKTGVTHYFNISKAREDLGYIPGKQNDLTEVTQWFLERGWGRAPSTRTSSSTSEVLLNLLIMLAFTGVLLSCLPVCSWVMSWNSKVIFWAQGQLPYLLSHDYVASQLPHTWCSQTVVTPIWRCMFLPGINIILKQHLQWDVYQLLAWGLYSYVCGAVLCVWMVFVDFVGHWCNR